LLLDVSTIISHADLGQYRCTSLCRWVLYIINGREARAIGTWKEGKLIEILGTAKRRGKEDLFIGKHKVIA